MQILKPNPDIVQMQLFPRKSTLNDYASFHIRHDSKKAGHGSRDKRKLKSPHLNRLGAEASRDRQSLFPHEPRLEPQE